MRIINRRVAAVVGAVAVFAAVGSTTPASASARWQGPSAESARWQITPSAGRIRIVNPDMTVCRGRWGC